MRHKTIEFLWRRRTAVFAIGPALMLVLAKPKLHTWLAAIPLIVLGEIIRMWAAGHLTKNGKVVTSGPFGYVRNPLYWGSMFIFVGLCIMMNSWAIATAFLVIFLIFHMGATLCEEGLLSELFGEDYAEYCRNVRRMVPRLKRYGEPGKFSMALARYNHEPKSALGTMLMVLLFGLRIALGI